MAPPVDLGLPRLAALTRGGRAWLLLLPSLAFLALFTYFPIAEVLWGSLFHKRFGQPQPAFVGLDNYARVLADPAFRQALLNNALYALGTVVPSVVIALLLAVLVNRATRINAAVRALLFAPTLIPLVAAAALFSFVFMPRLGLLDYYLAKLGVHGLNWVGSPDVALYSLMALTVWKNAGYYMLFYLAGLQAIPQEAHEAATLEGAGFWQRLWFVTLPYLKPTTSFVAVIALINAITAVDHVIVLTKGGPSNATKLMLYYIFQNAHEFYDAGKATAATVISVALLLCLSVGCLRTLERGATHAD
ncbi:MAG: sugar ABC transporter permease [Alphaproteobacteria bacterium]|nr:sugar ABC transporter permease [Alphaproteobacteria bacterium]